jgi:hypothetical protein
MIFNALEEDASSFTRNFMQSVNEKIHDVIETMRLDLSESLITGYTIDEAVRSDTRTYTFKSRSDAKEFSKGLMEMGLRKNELTLRGIRVQTKRFTDNQMEEMVLSMAKDLKASIQEEANIFSMMSESVVDNESLPLILNDGKFVTIKPFVCESIIKLHDNLNSINQLKLRDNLIADVDNFSRIVDFALQNETNE